MKITKIREVKTPTRGTECSAGLDFYVPKGFTARLTSVTDILVPSGIRAEVPHCYALIAMNRSSVATSTDAMRRVGLTPKANTPKGTLVVGACVVDEDYQGEIYIHLMIAELRRMGENTTAERYEKILRINRDLFEGIDIGLLDYTHILAAQEAMSHRGLSANSIGMYNRNLRTMYNRAVARGIVEDASPWKRATTAVAKTKSRALSDTQFKALLAINMDEFYKWGGVEKDTTRKGYRQAYDLFILSFLLRGISPADLASLTPSNFRNGNMTYARKKTHQVLSMKVPEKAKKIIRKYKADDRSLLGVSLNRIRQLNSFLTKIGEYIGFSEPLTFYCARHTWASLSNAAEVPLTVISKGMGHTDIKTTQIYLASIQTDVVDRYSEKLYTKYGL